MSVNRKIFILIGIVILSIFSFLMYDLGSNISYVLEKRSIKLWAILLVGSCIAYSTIIFQTISQNKILTPSIIGFEALYLLIQTIIVFVYGDKTYRVLGNENNFLITVVMMVLFSLVLFGWLLKRDGNNIFKLLLIGVVLTTLLTTITSFLQLIIDPNEFLLIEGKMFATFNKVNENLLIISTVIFLITAIIGSMRMKKLDIISLGRDTSTNLGIDYNKEARWLLFIVAIQVSIATALVGPLTFLGILVANLAYALFKTYKHTILILGSCLLSIITLIIGQMLVEHAFSLGTTVSVIVNFIGGIYFILLVLKFKKI